jgi:phosphoglycerate kinase
MGIYSAFIGYRQGDDVMIKWLPKQLPPGQRITLRVDLNVPIQNGKILDDARIQKVIPAVNQLLAQQASVLLVSHFGQPDLTAKPPSPSLKVVFGALKKYLPNCRWQPDWPAQAIDFQPGQVYLAENLRFDPGECQANPTFATSLLKGCDFYVMDAFSCAHRSHASTWQVFQQAPSKCYLGWTFAQEWEQLDQYFQRMQSGGVAVLGGAKLSTKLPLLMSMIDQVDQFVIGGGMANTLLAAQGFEVGRSFCERSMLTHANDFLSALKQQNKSIFLPQDAICQDKQEKSIDQLKPDDQMMDIGFHTSVLFDRVIQQAAFVIWNGPMGVFEVPGYSLGTEMIVNSLCSHSGITVAGGGETCAAFSRFSKGRSLSYLSTAGGAFLHYLTHRTFPCLSVTRAQVMG